MFGTGIGLVWDSTQVEQVEKKPSRLSYWNKLHSYPIGYFDPLEAKEFFWRWWDNKPHCDCDPVDLNGGPDVSSGERFFNYGVELHNRVNYKLHSDQDDRRYYPQTDFWDSLAMWHPKEFFAFSKATGFSSRLVIMLGTGPFRALTKYTAGPAREYAKACDADFLLITNQTMLDWKREKFRIWDYAQHYHEVLFLDADLLIHPQCPSIFDLPSDVSIAMVDDMPFAHMPPHTGEWVQGDYDHCMRLQGIQPRHAEFMLNSGFVFTRGNGHQIWHPPQHALGASHCAEQWWIQYQAESSGLRIQILDPRWNWQHWYPPFASKRAECYVEHYSGIPLEKKLTALRQLRQRSGSC